MIRSAKLKPRSCIQCMSCCQPSVHPFVCRPPVIYLVWTVNCNHDKLMDISKCGLFLLINFMDIISDKFKDKWGKTVHMMKISWHLFGVHKLAELSVHHLIKTLYSNMEFALYFIFQTSCDLQHCLIKKILQCMFCFIRSVNCTLKYYHGFRYSTTSKVY